VITVELITAMCFFFFSSRRRHTRWPRDWSSDVCSSDLDRRRPLEVFLERRRVPAAGEAAPRGEPIAFDRAGREDDEGLQEFRTEIGRASCRERGWMWGGGGRLKKK